MLDVPNTYKKLDEAFQAYRKAIAEELVETKKLSPLSIGDEVFLTSEPDELLPRIKTVVITGIIQDENKDFHYEARVKTKNSETEILLHFKDSDIGVKAFSSLDELLNSENSNDKTNNTCGSEEA